MLGLRASIEWALFEIQEFGIKELIVMGCLDYWAYSRPVEVQGFEYEARLNEIMQVYGTMMPTSTCGNQKLSFTSSHACAVFACASAQEKVTGKHELGLGLELWGLS